MTTKRNVRYFVGLDLGQAQDFTALVVLERDLIAPDDPSSAQRPVYSLRHLQRFPLGTSYPTVVSEVRKLLKMPPLPGCILVVDRTGVGRAVSDLLNQELRGQVDCRLVPVTITTGQAVTVIPGCGFQVPKKDLVGVLQVLLHGRRLQIASSLPEAEVLVRELENFRVKVTASANEIYEPWRSGQHDDLVLALALAAWVGELALPKA